MLRNILGLSSLLLLSIVSLMLTTVVPSLLLLTSIVPTLLLTTTIVTTMLASVVTLLTSVMTTSMSLISLVVRSMLIRVVTTTLMISSRRARLLSCSTSYILSPKSFSSSFQNTHKECICISNLRLMVKLVMVKSVIVPIKTP